MTKSFIVAIIIFFAAHFALLIGVTTPEKFVFDEVHYVPAARQMLEPVLPQPMLNPMHPPLAKQLIALSIRFFGDSALGWRYPGTLFGALAIVAMYFCGLALFEGHGPAIAAALLAFFNQMLFVQSRIAMLDIFALAFGLFGIAAFMHGFRRSRPHLHFALAGQPSVLRPPANGAACSRWPSASSSSARSACCKAGARNSPTATSMIGTGRGCGRISACLVSPPASS